MGHHRLVPCSAEAASRAGRLPPGEKWEKSPSATVPNAESSVPDHGCAGALGDPHRAGTATKPASALEEGLLWTQNPSFLPSRRQPRALGSAGADVRVAGLGVGEGRREALEAGGVYILRTLTASVHRPGRLGGEFLITVVEGAC